MRLRLRGDEVVEAVFPKSLKCTVAELLEVYESADKKYQIIVVFPINV